MATPSVGETGDSIARSHQSTSSSWITVSTNDTQQNASPPEPPDDQQIRHVQDPTRVSRAEPRLMVSDAVALHTAIVVRDLDTLRQLLNQGVDPEVENEDGKKPLFHACELGYHEATRPLLEAGADVESIHLRTHSTALHITVELDWLELTELLLQYGANPDTSNLHGTTALHIAIKNQHLRMIRLLLRYGANKNLVDRVGNTPISLAQGSEEILALLERSQGPPTTAQPQAFQDAHLASVRPPTDHNKLTACHNFHAVVVEFRQIDDYEDRDQKTMSVYELLYGPGPILKSPGRGTVYGQRSTFRWYHFPANNMEWVEDLVKRLVIESSTAPRNISKEFMSISGINGHHDKRETTSTRSLSYMRPTCRFIPMSPTGEYRTVQQIVAFVPYLHFEDESKFATAADDLRETIDSSLPRTSKKMARPAPIRPPSNAANPNDWQVATSEALNRHLLRGYLTPGPKDNLSPLQPRRTLDQYSYTNIDTSERDQDQVVFRWMSSSENVTFSKAPKMFMVDQLWLWIINGDTVVTCASEEMSSLLSTGSTVQPEIRPIMHVENDSLGVLSQSVQGTYASRLRIRDRTRNRRAREWVQFARVFLPANTVRHRQQFDPEVNDEQEQIPGSENSQGLAHSDYSPLNVRQRVLRYLGKGDREAIVSPSQLASIITQLSMTVFDQHEIPPEFQFFDFFEHSIRKVSNSAAHLLKEFRVAARAKSDDVQNDLDIQAEADLLVEIEDIHDELTILEKVLDDQKSIMHEISRTLEDSFTSDEESRDSSISSVEDHAHIEGHLQRVRAMLKSTEKTRNTLLSLLDLKQKQASIVQAKAYVEYSRQQANQAKETARQGRTLMLFTVVTILFLPLSFMSAFFAIEIDAFPVDENGKLEMNYVLKYMLGISGGLSVPFIFIAFNQDRFGVWMSYLQKKMRLHSGMTKNIMWLVALSVFLAVLWTSSVAYGSKVAATIAAVLGFLICLFTLGVYRLVGLAQETVSTTASSVSRSSQG